MTLVLRELESVYLQNIGCELVKYSNKLDILPPIFTIFVAYFESNERICYIGSQG